MNRNPRDGRAEQAGGEAVTSILVTCWAVGVGIWLPRSGKWGCERNQDLSILRLIPPSRSLVKRAAVTSVATNGSVSTISLNMSRQTKCRKTADSRDILTRIEYFSFRSLSSFSRKLLAWLSEPIWMNWIPICTYPDEKHPRKSDTSNVPGKELRSPCPISWRCVL